jgi:hypothetical protein|tara:strand:+ start:142 stop:321 length:180 start_codon:yes stop_codon:yes gene_type:complete
MYICCTHRWGNFGGGNPEPFSTFNMEMEIMKSTPKSQKGKSNVVNMEDVKGGDDADIVT